VRCFGLVVMFVAAMPLVACESGDEKAITQRAQSDTVQMVKSDNPEMLRAFAKANRTLDAFLVRLAAKDPAITMPALKIKVQDGNAVEYFWVASPSVAAHGYSGTIDNDPEIVRTVHNGQVVTFARSQIYDWTYHDAKTGKTVGNFTACALLAHEAPAAAAEFRKTYQIDCDP
jgi:uncharacterized protein YegJ (DUF2314 family)